MQFIKNVLCCHSASSQIKVYEDDGNIANAFQMRNVVLCELCAVFVGLLPKLLIIFVFSTATDLNFEVLPGPCKYLLVLIKIIVSW